MSLLVGNNSAKLDEANGNKINLSSTMDTMTTTAKAFNEDDSASEYTDPETSSAPTELLAEFLTSIMQKHWRHALANCKLILEFEPNNKAAKDFYPKLLQKVQTENPSSSSSDENCNYTSSLEVVDNEILDNDMIDDNSSSISSSNSTTNGSMDPFSEEEIGEEMMEEEQDQEELINASISSSDTFPESMSSGTESFDHRGNISPTFSFTSLLLDENADDINNNEPNAAPSESAPSNPSPFTSKIVNMIKRKLN